MTAHALMFVDKPTFYRFIVKSGDDARYEYVRGFRAGYERGYRAGYESSIRYARGYGYGRDRYRY